MCRLLYGSTKELHGGFGQHVIPFLHCDMSKSFYLAFLGVFLCFVIDVFAFLISQSQFASHDPVGGGVIFLPFLLISWLSAPIMAPVTLVLSLADLIRGEGRMIAFAAM